MAARSASLLGALRRRVAVAVCALGVALSGGAQAADTIAPSVPTGLKGSAVSSTQINLTWNASTDNVGVKGYYIYVNDVALTTTTATSFHHTGLHAGTTYKYRVSAFDAVPNHSAWTATPVAITTLPPANDTLAPSVPTGLTGTAVSTSQINLSWNASTDNVAVKGYYVYLNDVALAVTTSTSFQHTGLTAGTTYNYRVSAFDAVPNHSAWTATPVAIKTLGTAPSTVQSRTFSSTTAEFPNPERGFSRMATNLAGLDPTWLQAHRDAGYRLVTHRQPLSDYVYTPVLPQSFIDALNAGGDLHRAMGTKMVMQFSYDNNGGGPEPSLSTILGHIAQLQPFFARNADVIAVVHAGFLGTWGEWGFSTEPSVGNPTPSAAARAAVRDALLASVDRSTHIAWRDASDLLAWFPAPLDSSLAFNGTGQARSGLHNDCFLSNPDDSGTYWAAGVSDTGRTLSNPFRAYHAKSSDFTSTGGENCNDGQFKDCSYVLADGPTYHWRYLRDDWGTVYTDSWKAQGCFDQVQRSLGYRFQLDAVSHPGSVVGGSTLNISVDLRNVGWSRILSARKLMVTLENKATGAWIVASTGDMRSLPSQATGSTNIVIPVATPAGATGDYAVYLSMPDIGPNTSNIPYYSVRFANSDDSSKDQGWDQAYARFKTGTTVTLTK